jgi:hypothetical protein
MSKTDPNGVEMLRTMAPLAFSRQSQRMQKVSTITCRGLAYNIAVSVEWHRSWPWQRGARWLKAPVQKWPEVKETLLPAAPGDVLEWDESWRCVQKKEHKRWVWTAICRRSRHIVAFAIGDRSTRDLSAVLGSHPA